jgi:hypothetical protein
MFGYNISPLNWVSRNSEVQGRPIRDITIIPRENF